MVLVAVGLAASPAPAWIRLAMPLAAAGLAVAVGVRPVTATALAVLALAAGLSGQARLEALGVADPGQALTGPVHGLVTLLESPRESPFGTSAPVQMADGTRLMAVTGDGADLPAGLAPGALLQVGGLARVPRRSATSDFDYPAFLRLRGIASELELSSVAATGGRRGGLDGLIDGIRARAERAIDAGLQPGDAALLRGMVLGQDQAIAANTKDDFRRAGLAHLIAVSGQNVMLLGLLTLPLLAAAGVRPATRIGVLIALIVLYVPVAGAGASLQRAAVMGVAGLVATGVGRPASRWYALFLAAAVTLALNPLATGDPGWQLSFAAVAGIVMMGPRLAAAFGGLPRPLAEALAITIAATAATLPLLAVQFQVVSLASLPANLLALPAVAPAMWAGMLDRSANQGSWW
jgi:competence protein ComEC